MPLTNFPSGLTSFGLPVIGGGPLSVTTTGQVFFVSSAIGNDQAAGPSGTQGTDPAYPFKTLKFALTLCKANNGDVIYLMPGHAETVATAGLALNVAGVTIIGLGNRNTRPKFTFSGTASQIAISAASVTLLNVVCLVSIDEVVQLFLVSGAYVTLDAVDFVETTAKQAISFALVTGTDCTIRNCIHHQSTAPAANTLWIQGQACDRIKILNNTIFITTTNSASSSVIETDTTAPINILIANNTIVQLGGTSTIPISLVAATSGYVSYNNVASAKTAIAGSIALASCYGDQNFASHVVNKNGLLEPGVDA